TLEQNTTYYVRAFATNSIGTGYGEDVIFTTPERSVDSDFKPTGLKLETLEELLAIPTDEFYTPRPGPVTRSSELNIQLGVPSPGRQFGQSCAGWAVGYGMMSYLYHSFEGYSDHDDKEKNYNENENLFSSFYIWNQVRHDEWIGSLLNNNVGISISKALSLVKNQGCCKLPYMPITNSYWNKLPSNEAKKNGTQYKITNYIRSKSFDLKKMKKYLADDKVPLVIGFTIDNNFRKNGSEQFEIRDGKWVWNGYKGEPNLNHAVLICGFDDNINAFKVLNSWGTKWGQDGYFWLDYDFAKTAINHLPLGIEWMYEIYIAHVERPEVKMTEVSEITSYSAKCKGQITRDWGIDIEEKGFCWGTDIIPRNYTDKITVAGDAKVLTRVITGLSPGTTYYVSTYAKNKHGVSYSKPIKFTTLSIQIPTVKTTPVTIYGISSTSAKVGGTVTSDGGSAVTERGVYYRKSTDPEQREEKLKIGAGKGTFSAVLENLEPNTTYYVRAYAVNSQGTAYGNQISFKTLTELPTLTTTSLSNITKTSVDTGGNITSDGGANITARGVCYDTSPNPTINGTKTSNGTGVGSFVSSLSGLTVGVTYYIRAYATNSAGTAYGKELRFNGLTEEINEIVPEEILEEIKGLGMPINIGTTPPNIEGVYNFSPVILKSSNIAEDSPGGGFYDQRIKIYDQDNTNLTAKFESVGVDSNGEVVSSSLGDEAHITHVVGNSSDFTLFVRVVATDISGEWAELIFVYSGTIAGENINSLHFALVMLNNNGFKEFIDNGKGRLFYDGDGVSERIPSLTGVVKNTRSTSGVELPLSILKQRK
ncbi:MAG: fibronectin type III domain-containing protein, partial [Dysgonamonadaceae bacterium]